MQRVSSLIDTRDDDYRANDLHNRRLASELKERQKVARHVRPERDRERLRRQNKMFVRDRIEALLDPGTPVLGARDRSKRPSSLSILRSKTIFPSSISATAPAAFCRCKPSFSQTVIL